MPIIIVAIVSTSIFGGYIAEETDTHKKLAWYFEREAGITERAAELESKKAIQELIEASSCARQ